MTAIRPRAVSCELFFSGRHFDDGQVRLQQPPDTDKTSIPVHVAVNRMSSAMHGRRGFDERKAINIRKKERIE